MIDGPKIKALRIAAEMAQRQLSVTLDTGETIISKLESNKDPEKNYTIKLIFGVADALGCTVDELRLKE